MKTKLLIGLFGLFLSGLTIAQDQFNCGLNGKLAQLYAENPQLAIDHEELLRNSLNPQKNGVPKSTVFTIPVVFHIIHNYGSENISDAQVIDQMAILNRDYRLKNADTNLVINEFKQLYADVELEFKLATLDPSGNCTNGIEHIYSHETFQGDDYSKLHQWPRFNYLNVWVVSQMENGVAGYAYYPTAVDGMGFFRDGIIILSNYIGSIGTATPYNSRALTHEIGHFLGLSHPWGNTNDPGVACGDDGIPDTPVTKGSNLNCNLSLSECSPGVTENVQNYMDYSYCSRMFTIDQATAMRNIIQGVAGQRNQLITAENAQLTGIDLTSPPTCIPIADFHTANKYSCVGSVLTFSDESYNGPVTFREWTFYNDASITTSTDANPTVSYTVAGPKTVRLIVGNTSGADTIIRYDYLHIAEQGSNLFGPQSFDLNTLENSNKFTSINYEDNHGSFDIIDQHGYDNSKCFKLTNYFNNDGFFALSEEGQYYNRLGGSIDELITPAINLTSTTNVSITFKYAYTTNALVDTDIKESLKIYASKNCGQSWQVRKTITGAELLTMGFAGYTDRVPADNNDWKSATVLYNAGTSDYGTIFKFQFNASDYSGNFFIDNINVEGTLGMTEIDSQLGLEIFPNPVSNNSALTVNYSAGDQAVEFYLRDTQGKIVLSQVKTETNSEVSFDLDVKNLKAACYFLEIRSNGSSVTKKIMIM